MNRCAAGALSVIAALLWSVAVIAPALAAGTGIDEAMAERNYAAALELLDEQLALRPGDSELRFRRARVLGYLGDHRRALGDYDHLAARYPGNVDYVLGRATVLAWLQRDDEALTELREASRLAPDYEAVWELRFAILQRQSDPQAERELEDVRRASAERFPDAGWWRETPTAAPPSRWTLLIGSGVEELSNSLPGWNNQFVELHWDRSDTDSHWLRTARDERFNSADASIGLGSELRFGDDWFAGAEVAASRNPDFVAKLEVGGHVGRVLNDGWVVDVRYRRREFVTATVGSFIGTVEKYVGEYRAAYSLGVSHLQGASNTLSHILHLNWYPADRWSVGMSVAAGEEAEAVAPGQVLQTTVRSISANGRYRISERTGISWWAGLHEQGDFYRRRYVGLAVSIRI